LPPGVIEVDVPTTARERLVMTPGALEVTSLSERLIRTEDSVFGPVESFIGTIRLNNPFAV
jgi:hypothetical protein